MQAWPRDWVWSITRTCTFYPARIGDSNFVSVVGETRVLPEELPTIYKRLRPHFKKSDAFLREFTVILVTGDKRQLA
jgi:hypothetical protein